MTLYSTVPHNTGVITDTPFINGTPSIPLQTNHDILVVILMRWLEIIIIANKKKGDANKKKKNKKAA